MEDYIPRKECDTCKELYDAKIGAIDERLKDVENDVKQIHDLTVSIKAMAVSLDQMAKELEKQGKQLEALRAEPAEKWNNAVWLVVAGIIGAALSLFFSKVGI